MADNLIDLATRQQVYLERLKSGMVRDWQPVQANLRARVRDILLRLEVETLNELSRARLNFLLVQLAEAQQEVAGAAMSAFYESLGNVAEFSAGLEVAQAATLKLRFNAPTAKAAFARATNNPVQAVGELLEPFVRGWSKSDTLRIGREVRKIHAQGQTLMQAVRSIVGTSKNDFKDGQLDISRRHAATVIHTATQHTANAARQEVWENNSDLVKKYRWISTLDRRTTQQCKSLDRRTFEAGKGPMPPIHPNCRSTTSAVLDPKFDFLDAGATRASGGPQPGPVDASETYYSWLKKQPAGFQDIALGKTRAKLFRGGGLTEKRFAELNIDRNFQPLTLAEMREIEPAAFAAAGL